jgi:hypothetical protein
VDDLLVKILVAVGSCLVMVLMVAWYTSDPNDS